LLVLGSISCSKPALPDNVTAPSPVAPVIPSSGGNASVPKNDVEMKADAAVAVLLKADDYDKAIEQARAALDAAPSDALREKLADAYMARAWYYKTKRLNPYTLNDLLSAQQAAPGYYRVYYDLGRFYNNQVMQSTGILELNKCIKLKPDFAPAYNERSACESRIYRWEEALADADKAVELNPAEAVYYYTRSLAYKGLGRKAEAVADLETVVKLSKDQVLTDKATADLKALGK
jgi:tetratricopeptide (TPR) repeat protein